MSVPMVRKYVCGPGYSEAVLTSGLVPACVSPGLVFEGLISARWFWLATGISATATFELNGPTTPTTDWSLESAVMLAAPWAGSCPFLSTVASSLLVYLRVQPPSVLLVFAWVTARWAAFSTGGPSVASPPVRGRSVATEIVPWQEARLPPPPPDAEGPLEVPQADSAAIPTTPKMGSNRLVRIMKISKAGEQVVLIYTPQGIAVKPPGCLDNACRGRERRGFINRSKAMFRIVHLRGR